MDVISNKGKQPDMEQIEAYISQEPRELWRSLTHFLEVGVASKPKISYSVCAAKPGWNVKYKKSGRALCTLYPETQQFTALIVLAERDCIVFEAAIPAFSEYICNQYRSADPLGSSKWLMISVSNEEVLRDVKALIDIKRQRT